MHVINLILRMHDDTNTGVLGFLRYKSLTNYYLDVSLKQYVMHLTCWTEVAITTNHEGGKDAILSMMVINDDPDIDNVSGKDEVLNLNDDIDPHG